MGQAGTGTQTGTEAGRMPLPTFLANLKRTFLEDNWREACELG